MLCKNSMCIDDTKEAVKDMLKQEREIIREIAEFMRN